jgi:hypothetical protein
MAVITTGNHPKALWPGVYAWWGLEYAKHQDQTLDLFDLKPSSKAYEELVQSTSFGLAPLKPQNGSITYASNQQGYVTRATHAVYGLGYIVTEEELEDNLYMEVSQGRASSLAFSIFTTDQILGSNIYNRAGNSAYAFGDGKELIATDHPNSTGGTWSNELNPGAALSEIALEDLLIQIGNTQNDTGLQIALQGQTLHVPVSEQFNAERILKSALQNDTANNAINAIRSMGLLPGGIKVNNYFTDTNNWFVRTNVPTGGLMKFLRRPVKFEQDNDFDTGNAKAKSTFRVSYTVGDPRALYGSLPA